MATNQQFVTLNNGNKIPAVGIIGTGTAWFKKQGQEEVISPELIEQIKYALSLPGVIHIDAAECYNTYVEVGKALEQSNRPRDQIFITDKFSPQANDGRTVSESFERGLARMGVDYVDLYLIHCPFISRQGYSLEDAWSELEALYESGKAKNIGVSNFRVSDLQRILKSGKVKPQVNQIEFHAFLQNQTPGIFQFCQQQQIQLEAYSPLAPLQRKSDELKTAAGAPFYHYLEQLASKYNKSEALILLRWVTKRHVIPVTTSSKPARVKDAQENLFTFDLTDQEVDQITSLGLLHKPLRLYWNEVYADYDSQAQQPL
ncbi:hypothetical protein HG536_0F02920 [Torulaspora globosa]|uniref:NADP-dependent oxidoreductase domain-containing protein n=1 Tax=Torulaspora globosa TaxID=48254 RepID=A0A7G3ZKD1_9SACH|nr:uncharacterized protein HG536_0F02920 [Torulaspora globosa]QLL33967.1 hypothetical protein HG536_0F02920 [Torulaspora globosa]